MVAILPSTEEPHRAQEGRRKMKEASEAVTGTHTLSPFSCVVPLLEHRNVMPCVCAALKRGGNESFAQHHEDVC